MMVVGVKRWKWKVREGEEGSVNVLKSNCGEKMKRMGQERECDAQKRGRRINYILTSLTLRKILVPRTLAQERECEGS
jgi:hypothetical protein